MSSPPSSSESERPAHPNATLVACILASSLAFIDGSVTNVALPAIGADLQASAAELQWTINAYLLPLSALLLLGGAAGDHYGNRRLLAGGIALFALASVACALAADLSVLLAARAAQGVGAAMLLPNSLAILGNAFTGEARGRAIGTWAASGAMMAAVGPPLGGWLVDSVGWRAIFYLNIPVAALALLLIARFVASGERETRALDWPGAATATLGLGALTWGLTIWSSRGDWDGEVAATLAAGALLTALFLWIEHRRGDRAMMPLSLFVSRAFAGLTLLTFLLYGALGGVLLLLPYVLIEAGGYSAFEAGMALLPLAIGIGLGSRLTGNLAVTFGPRLPLTLGPLIVAAGFALLLLVEPGASYWTHVFPGIAGIAIGMAGTAAPLTTAVLATVDPHHSGTASGFNSAVARTGGLIATAISGAVIAAAGTALVSAFHAAALVCAVLALISSATAFLTLPGRENRAPSG